ncbi:glycosyl hydrolase [Dawidia soli]|uniref:Glycoside hydrolase family 2 n=1 Tax=Dawidia soli TaxID=2782352 RepID=A0AAP2GDD7_9BACT|nr:glycosyl hydrolase [Dawidia soli]MBT1687244.1 glycoside hydrolase family 2 [Dawidia soli]
MVYRTMLSACLLFLLLCANTATEKDPPVAALRKGFRNVPDSVQLGVYWYWISDNISKEGVVKDLEAMKKAGINRAFIGSNIVNGGTPYGEHKVFSPGWWEVVHAALKKATELNIEIGMFNCPGWSQSGGPWIKPEQSMRYLASSEVIVEGPRKINQGLPVVGEHAQDVKVLAWRLPASVEEHQGRLLKGDGNERSLTFTVRGKSPMRSLVIRADASIQNAADVYYEAGGEYKLLTQVALDRGNTALNVGFDPLAPVVVSLPEVKTTRYRLTVANPLSATVDVTLSSQPRVERYPEKSLAKMFPTPLPLWHDYLWNRQPQVSDASVVVRATDVVDLTARFQDGKLVWDVPAGTWKILRTAMLTTGVTNAPASPEATGLEVDKMSKQHAAYHFDAFIGEILRRVPAEDRKSFRVVVEDSYETGGQNWTDDMEAHFKKVYGYDPVPYLPVLSGTVVGSPDISDRFLWDLRRLIADRVAYDYVGGLRDVSHRHGLTTWLENYGHWGFPGEFLQYGGQSDEVSGEFWSEGELGNIENKAASSAAHIYGKRKVWAESFTAAGQTFGRTPFMMKQRGDRFFTEGINSTLLHVYVHQPYEDRWPGMNAWFGNEFNRKNTWFEQFDVFAAYLKRTNFLLQQGTYIADVAYFIGEDAPKMTGVCDPALPRGYSFDYINGEVLLRQASVKNGKLVLRSGMQYSVLVLPKLATMRPALLKRIRDLVMEGLVVLGPAPQYSPSLVNYPHADGEVKKLSDALWKNVAPDGYQKVGKGYVFGEQSTLESVFSVLSVLPDCTVEGDALDVRFIHRVVQGEDIYFISNQQEKKVVFNATFRTAKGNPELWDALTGEMRALPRFVRNEKTTTLALELEPFGSAFIVFSEANAKANTGAGNFPAGNVLATLRGPWTVVFNGLSAPQGIFRFDSLYDWTRSTDNALKYFSGTAIYQTTFTLKSVPSQQTYVDVGRVVAMGKVYVNDRYVGGVWAYPYRLNVTPYLKKGENTLRIDVVNNWMNRLIGDQQLPEDQRKTWAVFNPYNASSALQPSGLLGDVTIQAFDYQVR